jgi:choline monooxygenase
MSAMGTVALDASPALPPLGQPLEEGWTLPADWYRDQVVFDRERERVFGVGWQYAAPASHVAEPGSFVTAQVGHVPVVVVRDRAGALRGLVNVCRHRGHLVAHGSGCRETLQCPYHAWTYDLDGSLRRAPRSEREPGFDPAALSLVPVSVDAWGPFVFVNPDAGAAPLAEALAELPALVAESGLALDELRFHSHHEWTIDANWKVVLENFLECYHCAVAHPGFSKVIDVDPDAYGLRVHRTFSSQVGPVRASALDGGRRVPYVPRGDVRQAQYHFLWPATTINIAPGPQNVAVERWVPTGPRRTVEVTDYYFGADVPPDQIADLMAWDEQVAREDVALVDAVQAGLDSAAVPQGRLMRESEQLIADFQRRVYEALVSPH